MCCGKVHLREVGTDRATFGYVLEDVSENEGIKVYVDAIDDHIIFPRPLWNEELFIYVIDDTPVSGFRMTTVEPICIRYNEGASSMWMLFHKVAFNVDDNKFQTQFSS